MADDINRRLSGSWLPQDSLRHFMYESIYQWLTGEMERWPGRTRPLQVLEYGSLEPTTPIIRMLRSLLGPELVAAQCAPDYGQPGGDICVRLPAQHEYQDVVILDQVLEHVLKPQTAIDNLYELLRPEGLAIITTPFLYPLHDCPIDMHRFTPQAYRQLFSSKLWEIEQLQTWGNAALLSYFLQDERLTQWVPIAQLRQDRPGLFINAAGTYNTPYPLLVWCIARAK